MPTQKTPDPLHQATRELLDLIHRMPWAKEHRPGCPAAQAGPCTCGVADLTAEIARISGLLSPQTPSDAPF